MANDSTTPAIITTIKGDRSTSSEQNLPGEITESIAIASTNAIGQQPATLANLSLGNLVQTVNQAQENAVSFQQSQNGIQAASVGTVLSMLTSLKPLQAMSAQQVLTGNAMAQELSALKASVSTLNGPPSTGGGKTTIKPIKKVYPGSTAVNPITGGTVYVKPISDVNIVVEDVNKTT